MRGMTRAHLAAVFLEWARREAPAGTQLPPDYGQRCAAYFEDLAEELRPALPKPGDVQH